MPRTKTLLIGVASGAALMYFFDPQHGEDRRQQLKEQLNTAKRRTERAADKNRELAQTS
jgi:gas vesicle protein